MVRTHGSPRSIPPRRLRVWMWQILVLLLILLPFSPARADIAPPAKPPGANPHPGAESTRVSMLAETVLIDVLADGPVDSLGRARVTAEFHMKNQADSAEKLDVRFPVSANDGFYNYPEIQDLRVSVDGRNVPTRRTTFPDPVFDDLIQWASFEVSFPPGQEVIITVTYTLLGTGEYPYVSYSYLLETGAGWQGAIGSVDLIVRLPYEANPANVFIDSSPGWGQTSPGAVLSGRELRWHYVNLEPTVSDNLSVALVLPSAWNKVLAERENVTANPNDGEAWGRLGKIYKEISLLRRGVRDDPGGLALYDLSVEAYQKSVALLPEDALWHAGYGDLLFARYYYDEFIGGGGQDLTHLREAVEEFHRAYSLAPNNPRIRDMLDEVRFALPEALVLEGDEYVFLWMTATPTLRPPISTPTLTLPAPRETPTQAPATDAPPQPSASSTGPSPTRTPAPQATPTLTAPPAETPTGAGPRPSLCGAALVFPLFLALICISSASRSAWRRASSTLPGE